MTKILVTAVGSELAFSIIKAIKKFTIPYELIGCDIFEEVVGKYWCQRFFQVPLAKKETEYISAIKKLVRDENIQILIPTADSELEILSSYKDEFKELYNCIILINDNEEIQLFNDKWLAHKLYIENEIPAPKSFLADDIAFLEKNLENFSYPLIIKPRVGGGSRSIFKINSWEDILKYRDVVSNPIIQEYLFPEDEEYTAGTYRTKLNEVFVILFNRKLKFGMTNVAEVVINEELEKFAKNVILKTNLIGSNNIQFRVTHEGPKVLEINPRFSGTTGIRATFGFNDVEMWVKESFLNFNVSKPNIKKGRVMRFMEEQYHFN